MAPSDVIADQRLHEFETVLHGGPLDTYEDQNEQLADYLAERQAEREAYAALEAEAMLAYWDDDPNPYEGTYSEC